MMKKVTQRSSSVLLRAKNRQTRITLVQQRDYARQAKGSFLAEFAASHNLHTQFPVASVFGCTGFVGRAIVQELATAGYQVITPYRGSEFKIQPHKVMGDVGQIVAMRYATNKYDTILDICARSNVVVSTIGRAYPKWFDDGWEFSNVDVPKMIARAAKETNVDRLIHISHLGADVEHPAKYLRLKAYAERAVKDEFPKTTILRPSVAYGERDKFLVHLGKNLQSKRVFGVPVVERGLAKFQPLFVSNIGDGVIGALAKQDSIGKVFELGGPKVYKYCEFVKFVADFIDARYSVTPVTLPVGKLLGLINEYRSNRAMFTRDYAISQCYDNIVSPNALTFDDLGIEPISFEDAALPMLRKFMRWQGCFVKDNYNYV